MRKIPSLFARDAGGVLTPTVNPESRWVLDGEGAPTIKWDGTACMVRGGALFKRYDRKRNRKTGEYKPATEGWEPCQDPDPITGHWPGWMPIGPHDYWHAEAVADGYPGDGTYELVGPKVQANPHRVERHELWPHGVRDVDWFVVDPASPYESCRALLSRLNGEGIVWHHPDGRMAKIKRRDFGLAWPEEASDG